MLTTDALAGHGVDLPELDGATLARLRGVVPTDGNSIENPIDTGYMGEDAEEALRVVTDAAARDTNTDFVITMLRGRDVPLEEQRRTIEELAELQERTDEPIVVAARRDVGELAEESLRLAYERGVAVFPSPVSAGRAVGLLLEWRRQREGLPLAAVASLRPPLPSRERAGGEGGAGTPKLRALHGLVRRSGERPARPPGVRSTLSPQERGRRGGNARDFEADPAPSPLAGEGGG